MKKEGKLIPISACVIFAILLILLINFVHAQTVDNPTAGLESATGGLVDEEGIHTDNLTGKFTPYKSKAEERIDSINLWLENHASWFKTILGAVPSISWYFAFVLYFFLWGFVGLVLNARRVLYIRFLSRKLGGINTFTIFGLSAFIILFIALKVQIFFANIAFYTWVWGNDKWYWIALKFLIVIGATILITYFLGVWGKYREEKSKKEAESEQETNQEALGKLVEGAVGKK